jgi:hypothetical protein
VTRVWIGVTWFQYEWASDLCKDHADRIPAMVSLYRELETHERDQMMTVKAPREGTEEET